MARKYYDKNGNPLTKEEYNRIADAWKSFFPGHLGFTYHSGQPGMMKRVVRIDPKTNEEHTMYQYKD